MDLGFRRDKRNLEGFRCVFDSKGNSSDFSKYDGKKCKIIKREEENTFDLESVGSMWLIQFEDGVTTYAYADEIFE